MKKLLTFQLADRSLRYGLFGIVLGLLAPAGWALVRTYFFGSGDAGFFSGVAGHFFTDRERLFLFLYMGGGTSAVLGSFGYVLGKALHQIHERARNLDDLNRVIARQKDESEGLFAELNQNIKDFHSINAQIQQSVNRQEVLDLVVGGMQEVLGYDRVTVLGLNKGSSCLQFDRIGEDQEGDCPPQHCIPLDEKAGVLTEAVLQRRAFRIADVEALGPAQKIQPPWKEDVRLQCNSFILCPVIAKDVVLGLLMVDNRQSGTALTDTDLDTVRLFADQLATSITKIGLFGAVEALTDELELTFSHLTEYREQYYQLVRSLHVSTVSTSDAIGEIAGSAGVVSEAVGSTRSAVEDISESVEQVSQSLKQFAAFIERSIAAMSGISQTIGKVEENGRLSYSMSEQVREQAEEGGRTVADTLQGLEGISRSVDETVAGVERLARRGEEIDTITTVIGDITKKTNLLSLNASIIAAQAGEQGKAFAVVAEEIRTLSQEVAASTGSINGIIEEIHGDTRQVAGHVTRTRSLVDTGMEMAQITAQSLTGILESAGEAMAMAEEIGTVTHDASENAGEVSRSISDLEEKAVEISTASIEQAMGTRKIVSAVEEIQSMVNDMAAATNRQTRETKEVDVVAEKVSDMATQIFEELEDRKEMSLEVLQKLKRLQK